MAPGLRPGWRLRVAPLDAVPVAGEVVVLRSGARPHDTAPSGAQLTKAELVAPAFVVHRVVWMADIGGQRVVFHRGDAGGRVGMTSGDAVVGRVTGVLPGPTVAARASAAVERPRLELDTLNTAQRRAFRRAQWRCRAYVALRRAAACVGFTRARERPAGTRLAAFLRRLLLRA